MSELDELRARVLELEAAAAAEREEVAVALGADPGVVRTHGALLGLARAVTAHLRFLTPSPSPLQWKIVAGRP